MIALRRESSPRDRLKVLFKEFAKLRADMSFLAFGLKGYERPEDAFLEKTLKEKT